MNDPVFTYFYNIPFCASEESYFSFYFIGQHAANIRIFCSEHVETKIFHSAWNLSFKVLIIILIISCIIWLFLNVFILICLEYFVVKVAEDFVNYITEYRISLVMVCYCCNIDKFHQSHVFFSSFFSLSIISLLIILLIHHRLISLIHYCFKYYKIETGSLSINIDLLP